ncbi:MAG: hypothetical protein AAGG56_03470 [Pseudomonadota bacterium]
MRFQEVRPVPAWGAAIALGIVFRHAFGMTVQAGVARAGRMG